MPAHHALAKTGLILFMAKKIPAAPAMGGVAPPKRKGGSRVAVRDFFRPTGRNRPKAAWHQMGRPWNPPPVAFRHAPADGFRVMQNCLLFLSPRSSQISLDWAKFASCFLERRANSLRLAPSLWAFLLICLFMAFFFFLEFFGDLNGSGQKAALDDSLNDWIAMALVLPVSKNGLSPGFLRRPGPWLPGQGGSRAFCGLASTKIRTPFHGCSPGMPFESTPPFLRCLFMPSRYGGIGCWLRKDCLIAAQSCFVGRTKSAKFWPMRGERFRIRRISSGERICRWTITPPSPGNRFFPS